MKILVVSCSPWRNDNNIGNSYTNIFKGIDNLEIAYICCGNGIPDTDFVKKHLHISERNIIRNLFNPNHKCCYEVNGIHEEVLEPIGKNGAFDFMRKHRFQLFFLFRDIIWSFKNWICDDLKKFVDDFNPDIIFAQFLDRSYLNDMLFFLKDYTKKPLIVYAWDDVYTLKQFSISPLFWLNRFLQRKKLRNISNISSYMYVISELQQIEYSKIFKRNCKVIYKGFDFNKKPEYIPSNNPLKLVFSGNIGSGRWKTLAYIGDALHEINQQEPKGILYIYTATPISNRIKQKLYYPESVKLQGSVSAEEIAKLQLDADILVHVESFHLKDRLQVRLSFSTKLVDYFKSGRCILAIGSKNIASIEYLSKNHGAIVVNNKSEIKKRLEKIIYSQSLIKKYSNRSWECGKKNHQIEEIQKILQNDFNELLQQ
ncbi:glycosyltransferase involved in cell wall biosynthesis [Mobilisporobacter senegalensis]|uniref:Glycosyltransferase involved in cell wall biosynthesis n=1 Tax=Mobilisporobacter senegalensis TaxID=1329262 RepID=A0A3N1XRJ0_9FIRM|nr:glycosyltransferase family 1 protein [Mobilisporobacter senegalensis]ROR29245.1 glycosyltransferase involved in cell wall biosynthesis [Mobilisporobacter senegalensis]